MWGEAYAGRVKWDVGVSAGGDLGFGLDGDFD